MKYIKYLIRGLLCVSMSSAADTSPLKIINPKISENGNLIEFEIVEGDTIMHVAGVGGFSMLGDRPSIIMKDVNMVKFERPDSPKFLSMRSSQIPVDRRIILVDARAGALAMFSLNIKEGSLSVSDAVFYGEEGKTEKDYESVQDLLLSFRDMTTKKIEK